MHLVLVLLVQYAVSALQAKISEKLYILEGGTKQGQKLIFWKLINIFTCHPV